VSTLESPVRLIYRRPPGAFAPLREALARGDFHPEAPPDALAEWECHDDAGTRVLGACDFVLVECAGQHAAEEFDRAFRRALPSDGPLLDGGPAPERVLVVAGSDESGKGDRAQALAVAAVAVPVADEARALEHGVRDSKDCARSEIPELARWIARHFAHEIRRIAPEEREAALRAHGGNESRLLAAMHAECVAGLRARVEFPLAIVDRFAPGRPVAALLARTAGGLIVDECVRGERHVACAAASIVARDAARP
jgi:ribonuclease HII